MGGVGTELALPRGGRSWREEVIEEGLVDSGGGVGFWEEGEPRGFPR